MDYRKKLFLLIGLSAATVTIVIGWVVNLILYPAFERERVEDVQVMVRNQANMIESMISEGEQYPADSLSDISQRVIVILSRIVPFHETGEFVLGRQEGDSIVFMLPQRFGTGAVPPPVPLDSDLATPMREALHGRHGWMIGQDYRGEQVMAAYEHISGLDWGLVAKIDMQELHTPFEKARNMAVGLTILIVCLSIVITHRINRPVLQQIMESEERLRAVVDSALSAIITIDTEGRILTWNPAAERVFGYSATEAIGASATLIMPEPVRTKHPVYLHEYLKTGIPRVTGQTLEVTGLRKDGASIPLEIQVSEMRIGERCLFSGILSDITERKCTESELHARVYQQTRLAELGQRILELEDFDAILHEVTVHITDVLNVEFSKIIELFPDENVMRLRAGTGWQDGYENTVISCAETESQAGYTLVHAGEPVIVEDLNTETRFHGPQLLFDHNIVSGISVVIPGQLRPYGVLGAHTSHRRRFSENDIHFLQSVANVLAGAIERFHVQNALSASENRYRHIFEVVPVAIWEESLADMRECLDHLVAQGVTDFRTYLAEHPDDLTRLLGLIRVIDVNTACLRMFGASSRTELQDALYRLFLPESFTVFRDGLIAYIEGRAWYRAETVLQTLHGEHRYVIVSMEFPAHAGVNALVSMVDITEIRQGEAERRMQMAALEAAANGILITDHDGVITWVNPAFTTLTGFSSDEAVGQNPRIVSSGRHSKVFYKLMWDTIQDGQVWHGELINHRKDGSEYTEEMTITPVRANGNKITHFIAIKQDISERRSLEDQFRQAQKMEGLGRLASGVAHDFNNMLTIINGYTELVRLMVENDEVLVGYIDEILQAGRRASSLTTQLLAFSRKQVIQPMLMNLNEMVEDSTKMLRRLIGEDVELITTLQPDLNVIMADEGQINQVLMNLTVNARDAMPKGGELLIETADMTVDAVSAHRHIDAEPGEYVTLSVQDAGIGMDETTRSQIFDPFFTTKNMGEGTGLGLSTVYGIVRQANGFITVDSTVGEGSTFTVYWPIVKDNKLVEQEQDKQKKIPSGSETILLVEDDEGVRLMATRILSSHGYTVIDAAGGPEALQITNRYQDSIHLLLTDVIMPKMNGRDLADHLASRYPTMRILYMSGYTGNVLVNHEVVEAGLAFIQKPFTAQTLLHKVRDVLDQ